MIDQEELLCHAKGERRQNYLNQIRCILEQMDDTPCVRKTGSGRKPILEYPGYVNRKNVKYRRSPMYVETPTIVNVPVKELRPTSEYWKHLHENDSKLQYYPVGSSKYHVPGTPSAEPPQRKKSFELAGGLMTTGCDCARHNGLQDSCRRTECQNNPRCKTDPPTCDPSSANATPANVNVQEKFAQAIRDHPPRQKHYCCCDPDHRPVDPRGLPRDFQPIPCRKR